MQQDTSEGQPKRSGIDVRQPGVPIRLIVVDGVAVPATQYDAERLAEEEADIAANPEKYKDCRWMPGQAPKEDIFLMLD